MNMDHAQLTLKIKEVLRPGLLVSDFVKALNGHGIYSWSINKDGFWLYGSYEAVITADLGPGLDFESLIRQGLEIEVLDKDPDPTVIGGNGSERQIEAAPKFYLNETIRKTQELLREKEALRKRQKKIDSVLYESLLMAIHIQINTLRKILRFLGEDLSDDENDSLNLDELLSTDRE